MASVYDSSYYNVNKEFIIDHSVSKYSFFVIINPRRACATRVTACLCVCLSVTPGNLRTGASRRLTEGTSGLSGTFFTKYKGVFSKTASLET